MRWLINTLATLALALVIVLLAMLGYRAFHTSSVDVRERRVLELALGQIPTPRYAKVQRTYSVTAPGRVMAAEDVSGDRGENIVFADYSAALQRRGWAHCGPMPDPNAVPLENRFARGGLLLTLRFSQDQPGVFSLSLAPGRCA